MLDAATGGRGVSGPRASQAVGVARQLADEAAHGRRWSHGLAPRALGVALTAAAYGAFATVVWAAYGQLGGPLGLDRPPLVTAAGTPVKVTPTPGAAPNDARSLADLAAAPPHPARSLSASPRSSPIAPAASEQPPMWPASARALDGDPVSRATAALEASSPLLRSLRSQQPRELSHASSEAVASEGLNRVHRAAASDARPTPPPAPGLSPDAKAGQLALAALEPLDELAGGIMSEPVRSLPSAPPPELSEASFPVGASEGLDGARRPAKSEVRSVPPLAPNEVAGQGSNPASAPLPAPKPRDAAAVVAAAEAPVAATAEPAAPGATTPPRLPALKPVGRVLATAAPEPDACAAAATGHLADGCGVRLAEARDEGVLQSFWSRLTDFLSAGARPSVVAANDSGHDLSADWSSPDAGSDPAGEAGSPGPAGGNPVGGGSPGGTPAGGSPTGGNTAGGGPTGGTPTGAGVGGVADRVGGTVADAVGGIGGSVRDTVGNVGASLGGGDKGPGGGGGNKGGGDKGKGGIGNGGGKGNGGGGNGKGGGGKGGGGGGNGGGGNGGGGGKGHK